MGESMRIDKQYLNKLYSNPFNYTGSKHRYLEALFSVLPDSEHLKVVDPFVGGGDLISKLPSTWSIFASDAMPQLVDMHKAIQNGVITSKRVGILTHKFALNKVNEPEFMEFKRLYNEDVPMLRTLWLYTLICHSNSNRLRFGPNGFNVPFGNRTFNINMESKLDNYSEALKRLTIDFKCKKYTDVDFNNADLLLIDPPYLNTVATYNERGGWTINDEFELYTKINKSVARGVKFVYFGQIWSNGIHNAHLDSWSSQFNVKVLKDTTKHCSANRGKGKTIEVMISN